MKISPILAVALAAAFAAPLQAQVLNFEGIATTYPFSNDVTVGGFYNGGTSGAGTTGTNYGIDFSSNALAICLNSTTVFCSNTSRGGLGNAASQKSGLYFLDGAQTYMNRSAGFTVGFSFFYTAPNSGGSFSVWDGLNGSGTLLGTLNLATTPSLCTGFSATFCPFQAAGLAFAGTAKSVTFAGVANQIVFDDVTFGSVIPDVPVSTVPEPSTVVLMAAGMAALALSARKRMKV